MTFNKLIELIENWRNKYKEINCKLDIQFIPRTQHYDAGLDIHFFIPLGTFEKGYEQGFNGTITIGDQPDPQLDSEMVYNINHNKKSGVINNEDDFNKFLLGLLTA